MQINKIRCVGAFAQREIIRVIKMPNNGNNGRLCVVCCRGGISCLNKKFLLEAPRAVKCFDKNSKVRTNKLKSWFCTVGSFLIVNILAMLGNTS